MADISDQKLLYHLTSLQNVRSILESGLMPRSSLHEFIDVADREIISNRSAHQLDEYVPFHWFARNPFDGRVQRDHPKEIFVLFSVRRELAKSRNWKVITRHPLANAPFQLHDYQVGFDLIDWGTMNRRDYHDAECKSICMAECLSPDIVTRDLFFKIFVPTEPIAKIVTSIAASLKISVDVHANRNMFN